MLLNKTQRLKLRSKNYGETNAISAETNQLQIYIVCRISMYEIVKFLKITSIRSLRMKNEKNEIK